jgi:protein associated with RNAse G/E
MLKPLMRVIMEKHNTVCYTNLSSKNSFAVLDNEFIAYVALDMDICISDDQFDLIDMMKEIEIASHAVDIAKKKDYPIVDELED